MDSLDLIIFLHCAIEMEEAEGACRR